MDVDFWGVKYSVSENAHDKEVKCSKIRKKKLNFKCKSYKLNVKAAENQSKFPVFIFHISAETILLSKFYYTTDVVRDFSVQIF
jgi:hypothetical protein